MRETSTSDRNAKVVLAVRAAVDAAVLRPDAETTDDVQFADALNAAVRAAIPDATNDEIERAIQAVSDEDEREEAIIASVERIAARLQQPPRLNESLGSIVMRAARTGDVEAVALLPRMGQPLRRSYLLDRHG